MFSVEHGRCEEGAPRTTVEYSCTARQYQSLQTVEGNRLSITERSATRGNSKQRHNRTMKGDGEQYYSNEYEAVSAREAFRFSVEANIRSLICTSRESVPNYDSRATTCSSFCVFIFHNTGSYCLFILKYCFSTIKHKNKVRCVDKT